MQQLSKLNVEEIPYRYFIQHIQDKRGYTTEQAAEEVYKVITAGSNDSDVYGFKFTKDAFMTGQNAAKFV